MYQWQIQTCNIGSADIIQSNHPPIFVKSAMVRVRTTQIQIIIDINKNAFHMIY